jgi:hypothetical protein
MLRMSDTQPPAAQPEPPEEQPTEQTASLPSPPPPPPAAAQPGPPGPPPAWTPAAPAAPRTRLRDRLFGLTSLIAVGVAGVIVGGLAGFGIHAATDDEHRDGRMGRFGPAFGPGDGFRDGHGGFQRGGPGQFPGGPGQGPWVPPGGQATPSPTTAPSPSS